MADEFDPVKVRESAIEKAEAVRAYVRLRIELKDAERAQRWVAEYRSKMEKDLYPECGYHPLSLWWSEMCKQTKIQEDRAAAYEQSIRERVQKASDRLVRLGMSYLPNPEVYGRIKIWYNENGYVHRFGYEFVGEGD